MTVSVLYLLSTYWIHQTNSVILTEIHNCSDRFLLSTYHWKFDSGYRSSKLISTMDVFDTIPRIQKMMMKCANLQTPVQ